MMAYHLSFNSTESAGLRSRLEKHLATVFSNQSINKYLAIDDGYAEMQIVDSCPDKAHALPQTKLAYSIWLGMCAEDRHAVLGKFYGLYTNLYIADMDSRKTLTFCALFVNEFAGILAEAMEWPD